MLTWILDQHVDRIRGAATPFIEAARNRNHTVYGLRDSILPKPIDLTGIKTTGPTIVRGSHGFVNYVQNALGTSPGGFTHPTNFQLSTYAEIMTDHCLNGIFHVTEYGVIEAMLKEQKSQASWFIKPLEEIKKFSGVVVKPRQSIEEAHIQKYGKWIRPDDTCKIVLSLAKEIGREYRVVVVDGKSITGSTYDMSEMAPAEILKFVDQIAAIWNPTDAYAVDVATSPEGMKIVEYNQFGTSAMYACDQEKIIDALENLLVS